jgi:hypothetical protein
MGLFVFGIGSVAGLSFFELMIKSKLNFILDRVWSIVSLLNESEVNCLLIERNIDQNKACNSTNVSVGMPIELTSLAIHIEGLINGRGQQAMNKRFAQHCK